MDEKKIITLDEVYQIAIAYLAKFYVTKKKLKDFLKSKIHKLNPYNIEESDLFISSVIEKLENKKYLNDDLIAESKIQSMIKKGKSIYNIKANLYSKGLQNSLEKSIKDNNLSLDEMNLLALINYLEKKKLPPFKEKNLTEEEIKKIQQKLIMLGFKFEIIESTLKSDKSYLENIKYELNIKNDK